MLSRMAFFSRLFDWARRRKQRPDAKQQARKEAEARGRAIAATKQAETRPVSPPQQPPRLPPRPGIPVSDSPDGDNESDEPFVIPEPPARPRAQLPPRPPQSPGPRTGILVSDDPDEGDESDEPFIIQDEPPRPPKPPQPPKPPGPPEPQPPPQPQVPDNAPAITQEDIFDWYRKHGVDPTLPPKMGVLEPDPPESILGPTGHTGHSIIDPREVGDSLEISDLESFLSGEMIVMADSSNVDWFQYLPDTRQLKVGFGKGGRKKSTYLYDQISPVEAASIFSFRSKGTWVWDNLRVRGTVHGHKKPYRKIA